jgi:ZIP family zinc transporter
MLGFAAGVMMAASVFSLILPALEEARTDLGNETAATLVVIAGILIARS